MRSLTLTTFLVSLILAAAFQHHVPSTRMLSRTTLNTLLRQAVTDEVTCGPCPLAPKCKGEYSTKGESVWLKRVVVEVHLPIPTIINYAWMSAVLIATASLRDWICCNRSKKLFGPQHPLTIQMSVTITDTWKLEKGSVISIIDSFYVNDWHQSANMNQQWTSSLHLIVDDNLTLIMILFFWLSMSVNQNCLSSSALLLHFTSPSLLLGSH